MMKHAGARFMFCVDKYLKADFVQILEGVRPELPELEQVVFLGGAAPEWGKSFDELWALGEGL